jgi:23S rRNA (cytosine1962-C5)-methyltransferase
MADYELIDFGGGRKLERFGQWLLDRPCRMATDDPRSGPDVWKRATARYLGARIGNGHWAPPVDAWDAATCRVSFGDRYLESDCPRPTFQLTPTPAGQVGLFPDQLSNWSWIDRQVRRVDRPLSLLNLFAYTGGSTLAAAIAGARVTHIDAARTSVEHARCNARLTGLGEHPIRWIVEDVLKFCQREVRRGNQYDGIILDPPSYGHGPKGQEWKIERDLLPLLELCGELSGRQPLLVLATCHTPGIGPAELSAYLADGIFGHCGRPPAAGSLLIRTAHGRQLPSGTYARWPDA